MMITVNKALYPTKSGNYFTSQGWAYWNVDKHEFQIGNEMVQTDWFDPEIKKPQGYSFFLFAKLAQLINPNLFPSHELEYDIQYESLQLYFNDFLVSKYNTETKGEYECMVNFIKSLPKE